MLVERATHSRSRRHMGNDVIAMLLIRKFAEHSTLYRLHDQFLREQGVEIPHSTLATGRDRAHV